MTIEAKSLEPGERLLWHGMPDVGTYYRRRNPVGFSKGLALLAGAVILAGGAYLYADTSFAFPWWLLPVLLAAALVYLPLRVRQDARRTSYALTDRRAIIERPGVLLRNRVSVPYSEIERIEVRNGNFGDLLFRDYVTQSEDGFQVTRDGFFAIANVREVERLLRSAMNE